MKMKNLQIDRKKRLMLLRWLRQGYIFSDELSLLYAESEGARIMTQEEARAFIRELEENY